MKQGFKYLTKQINSNNWWKALTIGVAATAIISCNNYYQNQTAKSYSVWHSLDYYGFSNLEQKQAFEDLMHQASILTEHQTLQEKFPIRSNYNELVKDLLDVVQLTQQHFTIRTGTQERWEINPHDWMATNNKRNAENFTQLGFVNRVAPINNTPDALVILGATFGRINNRIDYTSLLIDQGLHPGNIILLAGERTVTIGADGTKEQLSDIAKRQNIDLAKLTETNLITESYNNSNIYNKFPTFTIDTPAGNLSRPTTQTTIMELINWLKDHPNIKTITFISNQPYVKYQQAIIEQIFNQTKPEIKLEVIGSKYLNKDKTAPLFEALGTYIWAKTPTVLLEINKTIDDPKIMELFKQLYAKQPLIYQDLQGLFERRNQQER